MANTTNLNMVKPAGTDHALISVINSNMDIIDGAVGALPSGSTLQGEIDSANTAIGTLSSLTTTAKTNLVSAINEVDGDVNTAVNGTLTPSTGFSSDEVIVRQFGHFVMVKGYISGSITATYAVVAQISGVTMPSSTVRTIAGVGSAAYDAKNSCYFAIGTDGKIAISPTTTGSYLVFDVVYCV